MPSKAKGVELVDSREMACCKQAWDELLAGPNSYAEQDKGMMEVEDGQYFSFVQLIAKVT